MSRHSNHSLTLHTVDMGAAVTVGTLTNLSHEPNSTIVKAETGDVYDVNQIIVGQKPQMPFGTLAIKSTLTELGLLGKLIDSDGTHPGVVAFAQSHDPAEALARGAAGTHLSLTCGDGYMVPTQLTARLNGFATLTGLVFGMTPDGSAYPFTVALNANLPASPIQTEVFGLGKAQILGNTVDRITSLSVNFNPQIELSNDADTIWSTLVDVQKISPVTEIETEDPFWVDGGSYIGTGGLFEASTTSFFHLLRYAVNATPVSGGAFLDFAGTDHIKGTVRGLIDVSEPYTASGTGNSMTKIRVSPIASAGNAPIVFDLASAYAL